MGKTNVTQPVQLSTLTIAIRIVLLITGTVLGALAVVIFQIPSQIAPGGIGGLAIILNHLFGFSVGLLVLLGNLPVLYIAYRMLGGWQVMASTVAVVFGFSLLIDVFTIYIPLEAVSDDRFLNALYGGIVGGIGGGLILRGGGTGGGTSTLGRVLQVKYGIPLASTTLYVDMLVVAAAGLVFGWEAALYALVSLFVYGATADYVLEGPSVIRTAIIITNRPQAVSQSVLERLQRGVTGWEGRGMFTESERTILYVTIGRSEVDALRRLVMQADPHAFLVIGQGQTAYGAGFRKVRRELDR